MASGSITQRPFDELMMQCALDLAVRGIGDVEPNPAVGAVVVDDQGRILGEGWHQRYGGPHAEVNALAVAGESARGATLYVTLEPCSHLGKTPPCSKAVIAAGVRRVVIAMQDPAPHVDGKGIEELRDAGIEVDVGLLEADARRLVAPFVRLQRDHRPWFHAKWAMTLDGKIATRTGHARWISNQASRDLVHQLRGRMDAICVGIGTLNADDPLLTARGECHRTATRVVFDSQARTGFNSQLVRTIADAPVLIVTSENAAPVRCQSLRDHGVEVMTVAVEISGRPDLKHVALEFGKRQWTNVLVEGGSQLLGSFFDANLIDEVHAFIAPKLVGGSTAPSPVAGNGKGLIPQGYSLIDSVIENLDGDIYVHGFCGLDAADTAV